MYTLKLLAKHFGPDHPFSKVYECPVATAYKEQFNVVDTDVVEGVEQLYVFVIGDHKARTINHEPYTFDVYDKDEKQAAALGYDNTIIRELKFYDDEI